MKKVCAAKSGFVLALMAALAVVSPQAAASGPAAAREGPGHAVEAHLRRHVEPRVQSEVMVFGTWHLSAFREWLEPRHLEGTLALLERFAPTRIAIERLPPDEIALLLERAAHDPAAQRVLDTFAASILPPARAMQRELGIDRVAAMRRADVLLEDAERHLDAAGRVELAAHLLAAYEYDSAALQWSYLSPSERAAAHALPVEVREALERRLQGTDEIARVAMPLARTLGLQRLYPVDSQYESVRTLGFPEEVSEEVFGRAGEALQASERLQRLLATGEDARGDADLLALNRRLNSYGIQLDDAEQWVPWLTMAHPSGMDRFRYAMWELRNQRMAAHVMDVAASTRPERVLFIVGLSHKAYVDRALAPQLGVRLVQFGDYAD